MKIALLFLCLFFLKTSAGAQEWQKISPDNATDLKGMEVVYTDDGKPYILAFNDTTLFISSDEGQTWLEKKSYVDECVFPPYEPIQFHFTNVKAGSDKSLFITYEGFDCGSFDGTKMILVQTFLDSLEKEKWLVTGRSTIYCRPYANFANANGSNNYLLYDNKIYFFKTDISSVADFFAPNSQDGDCGPMASKILALDSRDTTTLYYSFVTEDSPGNRVDNLFKKSGSSGDWEMVTQLPFENNNFYHNRIGAFRDLAFPQADKSFIMIASNAGLYLFGKGVIDTVLKTPINAIAIDSDDMFIIAGGENGNLYYTYNYGNTWNNITDQLPSAILDLVFKPQNTFIMLYALTENGIWAIAPNLVSVNSFENTTKEELTITPNPANSSLKISSLKTELPQQISVYNSLGQLVFTTEFSGEFVWDFKNDIPDGMYTVAVHSGGKSVVKQVVILR